MEIINSVSLLLLAIWMIYSGVQPFVSISFPNMLVVVSIYSVITGIFFLVRLREAKPLYAIGMLLFTMWFVLNGILPIFAPDLPAGTILLGLISGLAGISFVTMIREEKNFTNIAMVLIGVYLVGNNLLPVLGIVVPYGFAIFAGIALIAGILMILGF